MKTRIYFPVLFENKKKHKIIIPPHWPALAESLPIPDGYMNCLLLTETDLIVDVDPRNGGFDSLPLLEKDIGYNFKKHPVTVLTASKPDRGYHFYFTKPANYPIHKNIGTYPGVEFLSIKDFAAQPGSPRKETGLSYQFAKNSLPISAAPSAPASLLERIKKTPKPVTHSRPKADQDQQLTIAQLKICLDAINAEEFKAYADWLGMLFAVHHATGGSEQGKQLFLTWSLSDPAYRLEAEDAVNAKWDGVQDEHSSNFTLKTLLFHAEKGGINTNELLLEAEMVAQVELDSKLGKEIKEKITYYQERLGDWVYVADIERYIHKAWGVQDKPSTFSARMRHIVKKAAEAVLHDQDYMIDRAHAVTYVPRSKMFHFNELGQRLFNLWRPSTLKPIAGDVTPFLDHCRYMFKDNKEYIHLLLSFLSANLRRSKERIRWALVIQSDNEQIGKSSIFGSLLRHALGSHNVTSPSVENIQGKHNSFLAQKQVAIIEELTPLHKMQTMAKLRTLITDDFILVDPKFTNQYSLPNTISFLMLTNPRNALAINAGDQRYCVLATDVKRKPDEYYQTLRLWLDNDGWAKIVHYLLKYRFDKKLLYGGNAPMTAGKALMIAHARPDAVDIVEDLIENEGLDKFGYLVYNSLRQSLTLSVSDYRLSKALDLLGYKNRFRLRLSDGLRYRVYGKPSIPPSTDILRVLLKGGMAQDRVSHPPASVSH